MRRGGAIIWLGAWLAAAQAAAQQPAGPPGHVPTTVIKGAETYPTKPVVESALHPGDVSLNFPAADVHVLAQAVLGDLLKQSFTIAPGVTASVTLVTPQPIARADVLAAFEDALRASKLALIRRGGAYVIANVADARAQAQMVSPEAIGFGSETVQLKYISAAELKKLVDPIAPDTLQVADAARNVVTIVGATGQRRSMRELISQFDVDWLKGMSFALYVPQHTDARILVPEIDKLLNGQGSPSAGLVRLIAMERINGVLAISARSQYLDDVSRWIDVLDREGESSERRLFVYRVQNGRSADLAKVLIAGFGGAASGQSASDNPVTPSSGPGFDLDAPPAPQPRETQTKGAGQNGQGSATGPSGPEKAIITSDETNNAVLVYGTPREYAIVEEALRQLDVPPLEVMIEAVITEVGLTHDLRYGVQWAFTHGEHTVTLNRGATLPIASQFPGFSWAFAGSSIQSTLDALSSLTEVNVLSSPKLLVLNNHTASLQVGDQVPIVTQSAQGTISPNAPLVNAVEYRDTGVILKVTPRVNSGGLVLLDIAQEVSDVVNTSTSTINSPTIEQRRFASSVAVQDGETIALGGLIKDKRTKGRSGVPLISAIPVLGALAGDKTVHEDRTEVLILLTPRVVHTQPDADAVTEELRRKIQAIEPPPSFKSLRP
jgi:general secretion pathway protein D